MDNTKLLKLICLCILIVILIAVVSSFIHYVTSIGIGKVALFALILYAFCDNGKK